MAWNPHPEVAAMRDFGTKFNRPVVVTFSLSADGEQFFITTYGKTKALCKLAGGFGDEIAKAIKNNVICPPDVEPSDSVPTQQRWERVEEHAIQPSSAPSASLR